MDTMGAILLCQAVKPVGKQGPVIELESHADALSVLVRFWLRGLGFYPVPSAKTVRVSDDPCHFRQVFLCGPVIPPVK